MKYIMSGFSLLLFFGFTLLTGRAQDAGEWGMNVVSNGFCLL